MNMSIPQFYVYCYHGEIRPLTKSKVSFPELCLCILPDKVEDEIRQLNRPLKTYHNRTHEDGELWIGVC